MRIWRQKASVGQIAVIIVADRNGRFLMHKRSEEKSEYPGLYGIGAGGKIDPTESPICGAARELFEETGIQTDLEPVTTLVFPEGKYW